MPSPRAGTLNRRDFLAVAGLTAAGGAAFALTGCSPVVPAGAAATPPLATYRSRRDLQPPTVTVNTSDPRTAPGAIFLAAKGPLIIDERGEPVWYLPYTGTTLATNVTTQMLHGLPVITWWQGTIIPMGYGLGEYMIYDSSYRHRHTVRAAKGLQGDLHEFLLTQSGTAMFTAYTPLAYDLRQWGGPQRGHLLDSVVQEVDVATGKLLFEWRASDHVDPWESYAAAPTGAKNPIPYDFFHVNSIDLDDDGNLLVSARNTWTVYKIERSSGDVLWRLGGKRNSFSMGPDVQFSWQHDARWQADGTMTLFDDGAGPQVEPYSRALVLAVDETDMTASVLASYVHPDHLLATSQGSMEVLPNGNVFVGYGALPNFSEYAS
ncbi:MAG: arylsulfotransferase family protein, partial [Candidatus Dormibacteraeota bacterium]|nr:arylsulfotransferase family protein [Candidatus Dormibacteraeota bacterium]